MGKETGDMDGSLLPKSGGQKEGTQKKMNSVTTKKGAVREVCQSKSL